MERREYTDQSGKAYTGYGLNFTVKETTLGDRLQMSFANAADFVRMVRLSLQMLVTGQAGVKDISGPVGIVTVITDVGQNSGSTAAAVRNIAYLAAMIAVNLAVMNLLPLPALDGGRFSSWSSTPCVCCLYTSVSRRNSRAMSTLPGLCC